MKANIGVRTKKLLAFPPSPERIPIKSIKRKKITSDTHNGFFLVDTVNLINFRYLIKSTMTKENVGRATIKKNSGLIGCHGSTASLVKVP